MVQQAPGGGGEATSAIDPVAFAAMVTTFGNNASTLQTDAAALQSDFDYFGIAPGDLAQIKTIAAWMQDQMAGLRRRQALAEALARDVPTQHTVTVPEPVLTLAQAAQLGSSDADTLAKWMNSDGSDGKIDPTMLADLEANEDDPDFTKAFYDELGPQQTQELLALLKDNNDYRHDANAQTDALNTLSKSFETYTTVKFAGMPPDQQQQSWNQWFDAAGKGDDQGFRPDLFVTLLAGKDRSGNPVSFDARFLDALGPRAFDYSGKTPVVDRFMDGWPSAASPFDQDHYVQLMQGLTNNPEAAAEFVDQNFDNVMSPSVVYPGNGPWIDANSARMPALAAMLHAATIPTGDCNPQLAKLNAAHMILWNQKMFTSGKYQGVHPAPAIDAVFGAISSAYFNSATSSVTSPVGNLYGKGPNSQPDLTAKWTDAAFSALNGGLPGDTFQLPSSAWQTFLSEGMRDPTSAAKLGVQFNLLSKEYDMRQLSFNSKDPDIAAMLGWQRGRIQNLYKVTFAAAASSVQTDLDTWTSQVNSTRSAIIDFGINTLPGLLADPEVKIPDMIAGELSDAMGITVPSALLTDPKNQLPDFLTTTGKDLATGSLEKQWSVSGNDNPDLKQKLAAIQKSKVDFSWQGNYGTTAADGLFLGKIPSVVVDGVTYNGDPNKYIKDPSENFMQGKVPMDPSKMSIPQREAYAAWLQDPAVQSLVFDKGNFVTVEFTASGGAS